MVHPLDWNSPENDCPSRCHECGDDYYASSEDDEFCEGCLLAMEEDDLYINAEDRARDD